MDIDKIIEYEKIYPFINKMIELAYRKGWDIAITRNYQNRRITFQCSDRDMVIKRMYSIDLIIQFNIHVLDFAELEIKEMMSSLVGKK